MAKIFLDLGSHNGQSLVKAIEQFPDCDHFYAVEPVKFLLNKSVKRIKKLGIKKKVTFLNCAMDVLHGKKETDMVFYEDVFRQNHKLGSSLLPTKNMRKKEEVKVHCLDINAFLEERFTTDDEVMLKLDIEGKEYDILESLIKTGNLKKYVTNLWVEWHWKKASELSKERHTKLIHKLNKLGYPLTGNSRKDEFYHGL